MTRDAGLEARLEQGIAARAPGRALRMRPMFGGMCFMIDGNMVGGAREGRLMLRVGKPAEAAALARPGVAPMEMNGRRMGGYVLVHPEGYEDDAALDALEADHDYLTEGDVFPEDLIRTWIDYKRKHEIDPFRFRPHPHEFELYYDI